MIRRARIRWLIVLMACIFPFKGAMAAVGVYCHLDASGSTTSVAASHGHGEADTDHSHHHPDPSRLHHDGGPAASPADEGDPAVTIAGSCTFCSAVCGAAPIPSADVRTQVLSYAGAQRFPPLSTFVPAAIADGLERPPRSA